MIDLKSFEVWFVTGSQHLYGEETLRQVDAHSRQIADALGVSSEIPVNVQWKPVLTTAEAMRELALQANSSPRCVGLILWMHTFSPAKMWIAALRSLQKPFLHLHTQFNQELPWSTIDMDFMNLNQSAHGDREFGYMASRLRLNRTVVVGFWQEPDVQKQIGRWSRVCVAWADSQSMKVARFGENMRNVAVTEGDKVEAQIRFGYSVNGYGVGDLAASVTEVSEADVKNLIDDYENSYRIAEPLRKGGAQRQALEDAARIELGLRRFLVSGGFHAFTDTFEDLHGLPQLPGIAAQRLMNDGFGFGPEGDWKVAALVRSMKVMSAGLPGGTSLMEDYTYHLKRSGQVLGSHMLEICPSIADGQPSLEIHPLSIGGKADPVRLVFDAKTGPAIVASVVDMGERFRMIVNKVEVVRTDEPLPKLPVARAFWNTEPNLDVAATAWILAGGAHHTGYSQALTIEFMELFAEMAGIEFLLIDKDTNIRDFKKELRWNDAAFRLGSWN
jgi:L-arabinose isomerase